MKAFFTVEQFYGIVLWNSFIEQFTIQCYRQKLLHCLHSKDCILIDINIVVNVVVLMLHFYVAVVVVVVVVVVSSSSSSSSSSNVVYLLYKYNYNITVYHCIGIIVK